MQIELLIDGNGALADAIDKSRIDLAVVIGHEDRAAAKSRSRTHRCVESHKIVRPLVARYVGGMTRCRSLTSLEKEAVMVLRPLLVLALFLAGPSSVSAQTPSIVGTWALVSADKLLPDGSRVADYGPSPHGLVIFTADGYYSVQIYRANRLKFASGDKLKGTPEEYKDASLSMSDHFGRYSVDPAKGTITFQIDRSSFPNLDDTTPVRPYEMKGDEVSWRVAARPDGSVPITTMRRVR